MADLVAGALVGLAFGELLKVVSDVKHKTSNFRPILTRMEVTLRSVIPRLEEISHFNQMLNLQQKEMDELLAVLNTGKTLLVKCSMISTFNLVKKVQYSKQLLDLETTLSRYFEIILPLDQAKDIKEILVTVRETRIASGNDGEPKRESGNASAAMSTQLRDLRRTTSYIDQEHFVGFHDDVKSLETHLRSSESRRSVVSIWGMGGLGKTTLARKLYKNIETMFELQAWVCVSQEWNARDLLERVIKSFKKHTDDQELKKLKEMEDGDMERYLRDLLKERRYLVVIDGIWKEEAWECLRRALPDNSKRSRIIITTRNEDVAGLSDNRTHVHKLRFLRPDESWELFCKKAFRDKGACPQDVERIGKQMVEKCGGLPLGIIVLSGLLSRKQHDDWHIIKNIIWKTLKEKSIHISTFLLDLSYNDLSSELKSCFLYFSLFPEDYMITSTKLVELWVAEGFIQQEEGLDVEESAGIYLKELSGRSLIQLIKVESSFSGRYFNCSTHDLLRDLAVCKAKCEDFLHIYDETSSKELSSSHIAIRSGFESYKTNNKSNHQVRTLSFLDYHRSLEEGATKKIVKVIQTQFNLLRVLDLVGLKFKTSECELEELFKVIGKLVHLKYLGLEFKGHNGCIIQLPKSIGNLENLQTLDVSGWVTCTLPRDMKKFKKLRHLKGTFNINRGDEFFVPSGLLESLTNLQTLDKINIEGLLEDVEDNKLTLNAFSKLRNLKVLGVNWPRRKTKLSAEPLFSCSNLVQLLIFGGLKNLPAELHEFLPKLKHLDLSFTKLERDPLPMLEKLPNLVSLSLSYAIENEVKSMVIGAMGFPKLETLWLQGSMCDMQVDEGAMPRLNRIYEISCTNKWPDRLRPFIK